MRRELPEAALQGWNEEFGIPPSFSVDFHRAPGVDTMNMIGFSVLRMEFENAKASRRVASSFAATSADTLDAYLDRFSSSEEASQAESGLSVSDHREVREVFGYANQAHAASMTLYHQVLAQYNNHQVRTHIPSHPIPSRLGRPED